MPKGVAVVWFVIFIDLLGFGIVLPSLAYFVHLYAVPQFAVEIGRSVGIDDTTAIFVGLLQTAYSVMQLLFAPFWGRVSDRVGRRPVLLLSVFGFGLAWVVFATASSLFWLVFARALAGAMGANVSTAQAYMADVFPKEQRARGMGLVGMAFGLGFVLGPALGALLMSESVLGLVADPGSAAFLMARLRVSGLFAAALSFTAFGLGLVRLPESLPPEARRSRENTPSPLRGLLALLVRPQIGLMLFVYFVILLGFSGLETMFSQFNLDHLKLEASTNGLMFTAVGVTMAIVQGGVIGPLTGRLGGPRVLALGLGGLSLAMLAFGFQTSINPGLPPIAWLMLSSIVVSAFFSLSNPSVLGIISSLSERETQGETMGVTSSAATLGRIMGPLIGGVCYATLGPQWPFAVGSALVAGAFLVFCLRFSALTRAIEQPVAAAPP